MRRIGGLRTAMVIVLGVAAVGQLIGVATTKQVGDAAVDYLRTRDEDAFNDDLAVNGLASLLTGLASIAIIVLTMIWLYRIISNHRSLGRQLTWAPGWAIGGWFLPPLLYIIPLLVLRETWKASAPDVPPGSQDWKRQGENPILWIWFLLYSVVTVALGFLGAAQIWNIARDTESLAEYFDEQQGVIIAQGIVGVLSAISWALVIRSFTQRHAQLTGEAAAR
jgi:hypothetical protein